MPSSLKLKDLTPQLIQAIIFLIILGLVLVTVVWRLNSYATGSKHRSFNVRPACFLNLTTESEVQDCGKLIQCFRV